LHLVSENLQRLKKLAMQNFSTEGSLSPEEEPNQIFSCFIESNRPSNSIQKFHNISDCQKGCFAFPAFLTSKMKEGQE